MPTMARKAKSRLVKEIVVANQSNDVLTVKASTVYTPKDFIN